MERRSKSYIELKIQKTRTDTSEKLTEKNSINSEKSQAELTQIAARLGVPSWTAGYLYRDTTLAVSQKGAILAEAYTREAETSENLTEFLGPDVSRALAQKSNIDAQLLTRAVKRTQNF